MEYLIMFCVVAVFFSMAISPFIKDQEINNQEEIEKEIEDALKSLRNGQ